MQITADLYVNSLVNDAFEFIRVKSKFRTFDGQDELRGVLLLNEILAEFNASNNKNAFYYTTNLTVNSSKKKYYIGLGSLADVVQSYFTELSFINVIRNNYSYEVRIINDYEMLHPYRVTDMLTFPQEARVYKENDNTGATYTIVDFAYYPDSTYVCNLRGKLYIPQVTTTSEIVQLPMYYRSYLRMELARRLLGYYGLQELWTDKDQLLYNDCKKIIESASEMDLSVRTGRALCQFNTNYFWSRLGVR